MKKIIIFISIAIAQIAAQAGVAKNFRCSSASSQKDVLRLKLNDANQLVGIAEIAQMPYSSGQIEGAMESVAKKVGTDATGSQVVWFADHYTERIILHLNLRDKHAFIEVFDTDDWMVRRIETLKCDFEGYYEKN